MRHQQFSIPLSGTAVLELPAGAVLLDVEAYGQTAGVLYARVDPAAPTETRTFKSFSDAVDFDESGLIYVGGFKMATNPANPYAAPHYIHVYEAV